MPCMETVTHVSCSRSASEQRASSCLYPAGRPLQRSAVSPSSSGAGTNHCLTTSESCLSPLTNKTTCTQKAYKNINFNCLYCIIAFRNTVFRKTKQNKTKGCVCEVWSFFQMQKSALF